MSNVNGAVASDENAHLPDLLLFIVTQTAEDIYAKPAESQASPWRQTDRFCDGLVMPRSLLGQADREHELETKHFWAQFSHPHILGSWSTLRRTKRMP